MGALANRMAKELKNLERDTGAGTCAWPKDDSIKELEAVVTGPDGTPYAQGQFTLTITIPNRYPFEPPAVRFVTPVYHPNIDGEGRICLDVLNMPPKGAWKPSINIQTLLLSIRLLLAEPNADDGLVTDITEEYKNNKPLFTRKATEHTARYARQQGTAKDAHHPPTATAAAAPPTSTASASIGPGALTSSGGSPASLVAAAAAGPEREEQPDVKRQCLRAVQP